MIGILDIFGVHTITLYETIQTPYGPKPGPGRDIPGCWAVEQPRLVRNQAGAEVVSTAQVAVPTGTVIDLDTEPVVRLPSGRQTRVISVSTVDTAGLPLPDHMEINCE